MLFGRSGSYNYFAIHSFKFPEVSQRTFKTKGLISIEGTFFGTPCISIISMCLSHHFLVKTRSELPFGKLCKGRTDLPQKFFKIVVLVSKFPISLYVSCFHTKNSHDTTSRTSGQTSGHHAVFCFAHAH